MATASLLAEEIMDFTFLIFHSSCQLNILARGCQKFYFAAIERLFVPYLRYEK